MNMDGKSLDITQDKLNRLKELFPGSQGVRLEY